MDKIYLTLIFSIPAIYIGAIIFMVFRLVNYLFFKSGKMTDRLNKRLRYLFIISFCLTCIVFYVWIFKYPSAHRSNKARIEIFNIEMPENFTIVTDKYNDESIWPDYEIQREIRLNDDGTKKIVRQIKHSSFYNPEIEIGTNPADSLYFQSNNEKNLWFRTKRGFILKKQIDNFFYSLEVDTITNLLKYEEFCI